MILYINTTNKIAVLTLVDQKASNIFDKVEIDEFHMVSEKILTSINDLLKRNNLNLNDLSAVAVNSGPGSYTGLRIGITTGNLIAYSLNIPVIEITDDNSLIEKIKELKESKFSSSVNPSYGNEPKITSSKPRL